MKFESSFNKEAAWIFEISRMVEDVRDEEAALMQSRWFDYRHLLPVQATEYFAHVYDAVYRQFYGKQRDIEMAEKVKTPVSANDFTEQAKLLVTWRARQAADSIGCKYEFYLKFVMNRAWDRGWRYIPAPNQMYGEELIQDAQDAWAIETAASLQLATHSRYKNESYVGHPDQDAYHAFLIEQIRKREHPHMALKRVIFVEKCLPIELAGRAFGTTTVERARELVSHH